MAAPGARITLSLTQKSQNLKENYSIVHYILKVISENPAAAWNLIPGQTQYYLRENNSNGKLITQGTKTFARYQTTLLTEGDYKVYHNANGTKTFTMWAYFDTDTTTIPNIVRECPPITQTITLNTIPRNKQNLNVTFNNDSVFSDKFTVGITCPLTCNKWEYKCSKTNNSWKTISTTKAKYIKSTVALDSKNQSIEFKATVADTGIETNIYKLQLDNRIPELKAFYEVTPSNLENTKNLIVKASTGDIKCNYDLNYDGAVPQKILNATSVIFNNIIVSPANINHAVGIFARRSDYPNIYDRWDQTVWASSLEISIKNLRATLNREIHFSIEANETKDNKIQINSYISAKINYTIIDYNKLPEWYKEAPPWVPGRYYTYDSSEDTYTELTDKPDNWDNGSWRNYYYDNSSTLEVISLTESITTPDNYMVIKGNNNWHYLYPVIYYKGKWRYINPRIFFNSTEEIINE